jgi:hypothetical protein
MRFLRILALSAGGFLIGSCADDGGGATVNKDISWYVGCAAGSSGCGSGRTYHDMTIAPKKPFSVTCKKIGSVIEFTITDPGSDDDPNTPPPMNELHPGSSIQVSNGNTDARTCDVTVRDYPSRDAASPLTFVGKCAGSSTMPSCTLQGAFGQGGWVWAGTLQCDALEERNSAAPTRYTLLDKVGSPINIAVDNCD